MPDPLQVLPSEVWVICIQLVISGQLAGPLELMTVSRSWESALLNSPLLWSRIHLQNMEDEFSRVWVFLYLSKGCPLDIDIDLTAVPSTTDTLQLIQPYLSRVKSVSIRPDRTRRRTPVHRQQWLGTTSYILATFFNQMSPSNVQISHRGTYHTGDTQMQYYPDLIRIESTIRVDSMDKRSDSEPWSLSGEERSGRSRFLDASYSRTLWDEEFSRILGEHSIMWRMCEHCDRPGRCQNRKCVENWGVGHRGPGTLCEKCQQIFPKQVCKECGRLGRYSDEICIERWGPGPHGPKTVCEPCWRKKKKSAKKRAIEDYVTPFNVPQCIHTLESITPEEEAIPSSIHDKPTEDAKLRDVIRTAIPRIIHMLEHNVPSRRLEIFSRPVVDAILHETAPLIVHMLKDEESYSRSDALKIFSQLAIHKELRDTTLPAIPLIIHMLNDGDPSCQLHALEVLSQLAGYEELRDAIFPAVSPILLIMNDGDSSRRSHAIRILSQLVGHGE
ncbi:hypothetical protein FRC14_003760 [Serendipita sp. 396]|nr:hypothetical protein FRC14_003760 [Serendipita sp. 396]